MAGIGHRGFMGRRKGDLPACSGISYGSYNGTKSIYGDGGTNYLRNLSFSYDNSITGFTILSAWYRNTELQADFDRLLSVKDTQSLHASATLGTSDILTGISGVSINASDDVGANELCFLALSYKPNPEIGFTSYSAAAANGIGNEHLSVSQTSPNWNEGREIQVFKRNGGSGIAPGFCAFLQIIDQPISKLCCEQWTANGEIKDIVGSFNTLVLADIESGIQSIGGFDVIADISGNSNHLRLDGYSAAQKDPLNPAYCIKNIP